MSNDVSMKFKHHRTSVLFYFSLLFIIYYVTLINCCPLQTAAAAEETDLVPGSSFDASKSKLGQSWGLKAVYILRCSSNVRCFSVRLGP